MRFILGILIGAALTLFAATAVDAPTNPLFDKVVNLWDSIVETTAEALFENPPLSSSHNISNNTSNNTSHVTSLSNTRERTTPDELSTPESPFAFAASALEVLAETLPRGEAGGTPAASAPQLVAEDEPAVGAAGEASVEVVPGVQIDLVKPPADTIGQIASSNEPTPVWVSFHSQRSAEGFARQLADQFQHSFAVARQGPGDYQVVFDYASIDERDALLDEIAAVTGYRAP